MTNVDNFLAHHGILGMHWGVRKEEGKDQKKPWSTKKKIAVGVGVGAGVAAVGVAAFLLTRHAVKMSDVKKAASTAAGKEFISSVSEEPTDLIHLARGKNIGMTLHRQGGIRNPISELDSGNGEYLRNEVKRYGKNGDKLIASIPDPEGRTDAAGRGITHLIAVPKHMTDGINTLDDVKTKIYDPHLKVGYDAFYAESLKDRLRGGA